MNTHRKIATFHLSQDLENLAVLFLAVKKMYPGAYAKARTEYQSGLVIEAWAPVTAGMQILDDDIDTAVDRDEYVTTGGVDYTYTDLEHEQL